MGIIKLWHYLKGYVIIKIKGLTLERFLNLAANKDLYLWDIKRVEYTLLEMKTSIDDFKALKEIVKKTGCQVEIVDKLGLPFLIYKFRKRKMLGVGILVFFIIVIFLSSLVWDVEIRGNELVLTEEIKGFLQEEGVKWGTIKYRIDKEDIEEGLRRKFDIFSFVNIEVKGTKLLLEVKEQVLPPEQTDKSLPCNLVARKKGLVAKTIVRNGQALVRKGDIVEEGQVLISGLVNRDEDYMLVHAEGEILAHTRYSVTVDEAIVKTIEEETGESIKFQEIQVGKKQFQLFREDIPYQYYKKEKRELGLLGGKINLPFKIFVYEYKEVILKEVKQNLDFLKKSTYIEGIKILNDMIPENARIESKDIQHYENDGILSTYIVIETIEDIGEKRKINLN